MCATARFLHDGRAGGPADRRRAGRGAGRRGGPTAPRDDAAGGHARGDAPRRTRARRASDGSQRSSGRRRRARLGRAAARPRPGRPPLAARDGHRPRPLGVTHGPRARGGAAMTTRRSRPAFMILEMIGAIILLGVFALLATRLFTWSMRVVREAPLAE